MAKNIKDIYKKALQERSKDRKKGWQMEDSEAVALEIIRAQIDSAGKEVKIPADRMARITAALQITPKRIVQFIKTELKASGADLDSESEEYLDTLVDLKKFRDEAVVAGLVEKGGKGKKKKRTLADLMKS